MSDCKDIVERLRANCVCHRGQLAPSCFNCQLCAVIASLVTERDDLLAGRANDDRDYAKLIVERDGLRDDLRQLITTFEAVLDTRTCATKTLRALNKARDALRVGSEVKP